MLDLNADVAGGFPMSFVQSLAKRLFPASWMTAMEEESRTWAMRCPCGVYTSIWEMGGIRYKASGQPHRYGRCRECGKTFWGQLEHRADLLSRE
ncbi:MAG: hypothetical protein C0478_00990 [Planctomyces sp.]|nr:hypothetical protein [Planctomyces sp.]